MVIWNCRLAIVLALTLVLVAPAAAGPARTIVVGQVIQTEPGETLNGWRDLGGGLFPHRTDRNQVTTETLVCCFHIFQRGADFIVARTEAVTRDASGGVVTDRVLATFTLTMRATEESSHCSLLWIAPVVSFRDRRTAVVRSVVISGDAFVNISWIDPGEYCDSGD